MQLSIQYVLTYCWAPGSDLSAFILSCPAWYLLWTLLSLLSIYSPLISSLYVNWSVASLWIWPTQGGLFPDSSKNGKCQSINERPPNLHVTSWEILMRLKCVSIWKREFQPPLWSSPYLLYMPFLSSLPRLYVTHGSKRRVKKYSLFPLLLLPIPSSYALADTDKASKIIKPWVMIGTIQVIKYSL